MIHRRDTSDPGTDGPTRADITTGPGRFARWRSGWALALRMASRDVRRHWARSLLIVVMVGVPVAVIAAGLAALGSLQGTRATTLPHALGTAQARLDLSDRRIEHDPEVYSTAYRDAADPIPGVPAGKPPTVADLQRLTGGRLIPTTQAIGRFPHGVGTGWVLGADGRDPATEGMVRLVSGRLPAGPGEAAVTPYGVRHGLPSDGEANYSLGTERRTVRIVGVAEGWTPDARSALLVTLPEAPQTARPSTAAADGSGASAGPDLRTDARGASWLLARDTPVSWAEVRRLNGYGLMVLSRQAITDPPSEAELRGSLAHWSAQSRSQDRTLPVVIVGGVAILLVTTLLAGPAFAVSTTRQRHTLALSAINGAPGRQLRRVVLAQALVLGGLGAALSAVAGVGAGWTALRIARDRGADLPDLPLSVEPLRVGLVVAVTAVAALIAAAMPARGLRRLDLVPALRGQAPAAAPRRRTRVTGLVLVGAGTALMLGCGVGMSRHASGDLFAYGAAAGAVVLVVGALFVLPSALVWIAARTGGAPLPLRLAARDAARQRGRAVPATAAVMATVALVTAILIAGGSGAAKDEATYRPRAPMGTARVERGPSASDVTRTRPEAARIIPGARTALLRDPRGGFPEGHGGVPGTPSRRLALLPAGCPVRAAFDWALVRDLYGDPPAGPNGEPPVMPCRGITAEPGGDMLLIDQAGVAALPGLTDAVRRTLTEGGVVTYRTELGAGADSGGHGGGGGAQLVTALVTDAAGPGTSTGPVSAERPPTIAEATDRPLPTRLVDKGDLASFAAQGFTPHAVLTLETAAAAGLALTPNTAIVVGPDHAALTPDQETGLLDALSGIGLYGQVERGYHSDTTLAFAIVLAVTLFIVLVAALTSTALSLAEQRADLATLSAIGATRRARRAMAAAQALVVAGLGTVVGMALGFVPGIAMTWPATATRWDPDTYRVTAGDPTIVIPWLALLTLLVVVPAAAAGLAALGVRRTPPMVRRLT